MVVAFAATVTGHSRADWLATFPASAVLQLRFALTVARRTTAPARSQAWPAVWRGASALFRLSAQQDVELTNQVWPVISASASRTPSRHIRAISAASRVASASG